MGSILIWKIWLLSLLSLFAIWKLLVIRLKTSFCFVKLTLIVVFIACFILVSLKKYQLFMQHFIQSFILLIFIFFIFCSIDLSMMKFKVFVFLFVPIIWLLFYVDRYLWEVGNFIIFIFLIVIQVFSIVQ